MRIPKLSLIRHSLYVEVVEKYPPPPLTGEQHGNMEPKYSEAGWLVGRLVLSYIVFGKKGSSGLSYEKE